MTTEYSAPRLAENQAGLDNDENVDGLFLRWAISPDLPTAESSRRCVEYVTGYSVLIDKIN